MVCFPGCELLDVSGPWEVLSHANDQLGHPAYALELVTPLGGEVKTRHGLALNGARSLASAERAGLPDLLIVAGGAPVSPLPVSEARLVRWLIEHHREIPRLVSICTGAFVLAAAGVLDGRRVTTHWRWSEELRARFPKLEVVDEGIFQRSGRVWTSAGITAGIDLMLALVEQRHGRAVSMAVARNLVLFLRRSGHQAQYSETLKRQEREPARLHELVQFIGEHLNRDLPVTRLARHAGMSPRSLARACKRELGESPAALVRRLRVEEARRLLEESSLSLRGVAERAGLGDASTLWRVFGRELGLTPAEYRRRFAAESVSSTA